MDDNQTTTDWQQVEQVNQIKENLVNLAWEQIQSNPEIINNTIVDSAEIDPARMIMMERTFILSKVFQNYSQIPPQLASKVLAAFASFDFNSDLNILAEQINSLVPGLQFNSLDLATVTSLQQESTKLLNGLSNLKKIATIKVLSDLAPDITNAKKFSPEQLENYLKELDSLLAQMKKTFDEGSELSKEQLTAGVELLKKVGHLGLSVERFAIPEESVGLPDSLQKTREAFRIVLKAHQTNRAESLNDQNTLINVAISALT